MIKYSNRAVHVDTTENITDAIIALDKVDIAEDQVIEQFGLKLKVGHFDSTESFKEVESNTYIEVGELVQVQLETISTEYFQ